MRKLAFLLVVIGFTLLISGLKDTQKQIANLSTESKIHSQQISVYKARAEAKRLEALQAVQKAEADKLAQVQAEERDRAEKARLAVINSGECGQWQALVAGYNWNTRIATAVMRAESGCRANAFNPSNSDGSTDGGLFQVNSVHCPHLISCGERSDPAKNVAAAYKIYASGGWNAWSAYKSGAYVKYLQ